MKTRFWLRISHATFLLPALFLLSACLVVIAPAVAQNTPASKPGAVITNDELQKRYADLPIAKFATPHAADSHPDLSGVWLNPFPAVAEKSENGTISFDIGGARTSVRYPLPSMPSYKPEYAAKVKAIVDSQIGASTPLDPQYDCKPMGVPRASMNAIQIVQTPKLIVILYESNFIGQTFRVIYTDGRPHPKDLDSNFLGDSVG